MNDDNEYFTYALMGTVLGLLSYYVFHWPGWVAIVTGLVGPAILAFVFLVVILLIYKIAMGF